MVAFLLGLFGWIVFSTSVTASGLFCGAVAGGFAGAQTQHDKDNWKFISAFLSAIVGALLGLYLLAAYGTGATFMFSLLAPLAVPVVFAVCYVAVLGVSTGARKLNQAADRAASFTARLREAVAKSKSDSQ